MKKLAPLFVIVLLLVIAGGYQTWSRFEQKSMTAAAAHTKPEIGKPVPHIDLPTMDGGQLKLGGMMDKPAVINFWASWCGPCHEEAPDLARLYNKYKDRVHFYGVNVTQGDRLSSAEAFVKKYQLQFPILLDKKGKAADDYRIIFVPTSFLVDMDGRLVEIVHTIDLQQWEQRIEKLIQ